VTTDDTQRTQLAFGGQGDAAVGRMLHQPALAEAMHHLRGRDYRDGKTLRQRRNRHKSIAIRQFADALEVHLDAFVEGFVCHKDKISRMLA
jgi:hypothetical protein